MTAFVISSVRTMPRAKAVSASTRMPLSALTVNPTRPSSSVIGLRASQRLELNSETLATVAEPDGPSAWHKALAHLSPDHDPCPGFRPNTWARVWANALDFIDRHGAEAHGLGWTAEELFGVHPVVEVIRVDCCGALMLSSTGRALAVEADLIRYAKRSM